jgi:hypothetical protein
MSRHIEIQATQEANGNYTLNDKPGLVLTEEDFEKLLSWYAGTGVVLHIILFKDYTSESLKLITNYR